MPASSLNAPGVSSSWITRLAVASEPSCTPLVGEPRLTRTLRLPSSAVSLRIGTVNVRLDTPAPKVSVPDTVWKSTLSIAVRAVAL